MTMRVQVLLQVAAIPLDRAHLSECSYSRIASSRDAHDQGVADCLQSPNYAAAPVP
ncbi:hypothetical protein DAEQUDRAFT_730938 [Daedalea quercina L-15889]|uniref:Uncharacterized protein n=1 Tax=Daedalea quercina L-15889 TaxID=1314783 RepID=A0A165MMV3_9APHY|nr:hypothetical protein DAEQUDRAFT_730938 [Daedalea quercina L-15889]